MNRFTLSLIAICAMFLSVAIVTADYYPADCVPELFFEYQAWGDNQTEILFNPQLSTNCYPMVGNDMQHYYELSSISLKLERKSLTYDTKNWQVDTVFETTYDALEVAIQDFGGVYYALGGGVDITGKTVGEYYEYRMRATTTGWVSFSVLPPFIATDSFGDTFTTDWIPGPHSVQVADIFDDAPDEFKPAQRTSHDPVTILTD